MSYPRLGDYAMYPRGSAAPSGTWQEDWNPGDTLYADPFAYTSPNYYYDPELGGFFDVIAAPFKLAAKGVVEVGKTAIAVAPKAAVGFLTGGIPGVIAAGGTALISRWTKASPEERAQIEAQVMTNIANTDPYGSGQYRTPTQAAADSVWNAALYRGGQMVAATPSGQAAIKQEVLAKIKPFIIPAALIGGVVLFKLLKK